MATILATYVDSTHFTIEGEHTAEFPAGRAVTLYQGNYATATTSVVSSSYSATSGLTTVAIKGAVCLTYLVSVKRGPSDPTSMGRHGHTSESDAGYGPFSRASDAQMDRLLGEVMFWDGDWVTPVAYLGGAVVRNEISAGEYALFYCIETHVSDSSNEPGVGGYWQDVWAQIWPYPS